MFKIDNNRLSYGGISIPLPNGLYIDLNSEFVCKNGFVLCCENGAFHINVNFYEESKSIEEDLKETYAAEGSGIEHSTPITAFELNGLHGVHTTYGYKHSEYYEACFASALKDSDIHFSLLICADKRQTDLKDVLEKAEVKELMEGIRAEQQ